MQPSACLKGEQWEQAWTLPHEMCVTDRAAYIFAKEGTDMIQFAHETHTKRLMQDISRSIHLAQERNHMRETNMTTSMVNLVMAMKTQEGGQ